MLTATPPGLKLLDFGIAKLYDAVTGTEDTTRAGLILGTPAYMAPEQVSGGGDVTDRADVYSVGIILHRLVTARFPFEATSPQQMMMRHGPCPADPRWLTSLPERG
jgi:serine/threonine-protein kinase